MDRTAGEPPAQGGSDRGADAGLILGAAGALGLGILPGACCPPVSPRSR